MSETTYPYIGGSGCDWFVFYLGDDGTRQEMRLDADDETEAVDEVRTLLDLSDDQDIPVEYE